MENIELLPDEVKPTTQELINKSQSKILELKAELTKLGYLTSKESDGEDMSQYGDYKSHRKELRVKVRELENEVVRLESILKLEQDEAFKNQINF